MDDKLISPIENLLPGALSKWILVLSTSLSGFLLLVPSYDIPAKYITDIDLIKLLLRLLSAGLPLLIGSVLLTILLVHHSRKTNRELLDAKSEIKSFFHQNSSLITDKQTLQSLLDESKLSLTDIQNQLTTEKQEHSTEIRRLQEQYEKVINDIQKNHKSNSNSAISGLGIFSKE